MKFKFIKKYADIKEVLMDNKLARLGDAYVNFIYSLALSIRRENPLEERSRGKFWLKPLNRLG